MFMARTLQPPASQLTFHNVTVPVSAAQPPVGGLNSDRLFIEPTRPGSQILANKQGS